MNVIKRSLTTILTDFGYGDDMALTDDEIRRIWAWKLTPNGTAGAHVVDGHTDAGLAHDYAAGNSAKLDDLKAQVAALPTAQEVADAVLAAGGGGGLSRDQLVEVLNRTGLNVQEVTP
jgi:hypothetical protein